MFLWSPCVLLSYPFTPVHDGEHVALGAARLAALRTPGHTLESTSYLLDGKALFTGDTLFLDAVGRPDLHAITEEAREKAHVLYHSIQRLLQLPAETIILPGHRPIGVILTKKYDVPYNCSL